MNARTMRLGIAVAALTGWLSAAEPVLADGPPHATGKPAEAGKPGDKGKPADSAKPGDKGKPDDKPAGSGKPDEGPAASGAPSASAAANAPGMDPEKQKAERTGRAKKQRDELKTKVKEKLKNQPMAQAMKEELTRHAKRVARILRVKDVADGEKDTDSVARADKLLQKEQERHDKWMASYDAKAGAK